ncbi:MAG: acyl-CoA thioesterase [Lachnospiraceae bacterium]|nr:acyl-CoA thioesterase [Lachnospiraceae bacterium]
MKEYYHKVQYYETDMMQIVHHSNYIRWFEEARLAMLDEARYPYSRMEAEGCYIPVLSVSAEYKKACKFGETVRISAKVVKYTNVKFFVEYEVWDEKGTELRATGTSSHCFVDSSFNPIIPRKVNKALDEIFKSFVTVS